MLISIIMPVYNTRQHLATAVDSVLAQTHRWVELILIDDGSTDGSSEVCNAYASRDPRVVLIHQANTGVAAARNVGLRRAKGDYITFLDSDDWVNRDAYERLLFLMTSTQSDMIVSESYCRNGVIIRMSDTRESTGILADIINSLILHKVSASVCMSMYSRSVIPHHGFNEHFTYWEDLEFQIRAVLCATKVAVNTRPYYHYREGSTTHRSLNVRKTACLGLASRLEHLLPGKTEMLLAFELGLLYDLALLGARDIGDHTEADKIIQDRALELLPRVLRSSSPGRLVRLGILALNPSLYYGLLRLKYGLIGGGRK